MRRRALLLHQLPFVLALVVVVGVGAGLRAGGSSVHPGVVGLVVVLALASVAVTATVRRPTGAGAVASVVTLQVATVAVVDVALVPPGPLASGLVLLPALVLAHTAGGRLGPFLLAVALPPALTIGSAVVAGAPADALVGALLTDTAAVTVITMTFLRTRGARHGRADEAAEPPPQLVADAIESGLTVYDADGGVSVRNRAMARLAERSGYDFERPGAQHMYRSDRRTPVVPGAQPVERMMRGEAVEGELYFLGPPGDQRAVEFTGTRLVDAAGPAGWVMAAHDVTDLANAVTTREEMLLTFTHELRTPLTSIIGFAEMLQDTADLEALGLARPVEVIHRNATHLSTLVQHLLQAGVEAHARLCPEPGDVLDVARQTVASFGPKAAGREVALVLESVHDHVAGTFDPLRLRQALENLVSNALKYTPAGGRARVVVTASGEDVRIDVVDDGPGIDPQDLPQLFQRGFRSVSARRTATPGMGLGLAIARDVARAHGGDVTVAERTGPGAAFTLRIPRTAVTHPGGAPGTGPATAPAPDQDQGPTRSPTPGPSPSASRARAGS
ncbi:hypothetical protein GCM10025875_13090 [Litorihabitans aurantiacus]|uniref:histidine kinase n=1 Tax=Litorihabitans aurantiacus TaxID=1930061 RepID=A0AA37UVT6_9MICO|nr:hypothetical protein GCM10025875_13090 [Litorihabitans aurantiacus]